MTETTVNKTCDICGKKMVKDGPIWYGGQVTIEESYATMHSYPSDKVTIDACRECLMVLRGYMKVPKFEPCLTPEMQEMVERAVASMAREANR